MIAGKRKLSRVWVYFLAARPGFLTASAAPVLVGSAAGFAFTGSFSVVFFLLAMFAMMLLQAGSNIVNDYFDHLSGDDPANKNPTPFSGGSRLIQQGKMSPQTALCEGILLLAAGGMLGIIIVILSGSLLILALGIVGLLGGFFYTAGPVKLSYRTLGEITIAFLFGILPVTGSYFLQKGTVDFHVVPAAIIVSTLIFLIIFINEFTDVGPDAYVGKKTLVVRFGVARCASLYRAALALTYLIAAVSLFFDRYMFYAGIAYLLTLPLGIKIFRLANPKKLAETHDIRVNARTILLHSVGSLALTAGFVIYGLTVGRS
jgi:1,4-dihydroxy-2-naphthoate octaprenyltransferase